MAFFRLLTLICCTCGALPCAAAGQDPPRAQATTNAPAGMTRRWEIEIHAGGISGSPPVQGTGALPVERPPTPVLSGFGAGELLPTAPSWFFGEPAGRLNASLRVLGGFQALDPALTTAGAERQGGGNLGIKVSRRMTNRLRLEASIDHRFGRLALTRGTRDTVEASRASFARLFRSLLFMTSADASASIRERGSSEIVTIGAVAIDLMQRRGPTPFVVVGGGVTSRIGETPGVTLRGEYVEGSRALPPPGFPAFSIAQTDNVTIRYAIADHAFVAVAGGGIRHALSPRWVATLEARVAFSEDRSRISLDADPTTAGTLPGVVGGSSVTFFGAGAPPLRLEFNTDPARPSSLSDPPLQNFTTFTGSGVHARVGITAGVSWRF